MSDTCDFLRGHVVEVGTNDPVPMAQVRLIAVMGLQKKVLARASADGNGQFRVPYNPDAAGNVARYELQVAVRGQVLPVAQGVSSWRPGAEQPHFVLKIELPTQENIPNDPVPTPTESTNTLRGLIRHADGTLPDIDFTVKAFRRTATGEEQLLNGMTPAQVNTSAAGYFVVEYTGSASAVHVRVFEGSTQVAASKVVFAPGQHERLDVTVCSDDYRGPSEYRRVKDRMDVALAGVDLEDVDAEGVAFLAGVDNLPWRDVARLVPARRLAASTGLSEEVIYALRTRAGNAAQLLLQNRDVVVPRLEAAAAQNTVGKAVATNADTHADSMISAAIDLSLAPSTPRSLGKILDLSPAALTTAEKRTFLDRLARHKGGMNAFWTGVTSDFGSTKANQLRNTIRLGNISLNHAPLVEALYDANPTIAAEDLAEFTAAQWATLVGTPGVGAPVGTVGANAAEREENYVELLQRQVERAFPSRKVAAGIKRSLAPDNPTRLFLEAHPSFDFSASKVTDAETGDSTVTASLRRYQRLFRIGPKLKRDDAMLAMVAAGYQSARDITRGGKRRAISALESSVGAVAAEQIYASATTTASIAAALFTQHLPSLQGSGSPVLGDVTSATVPEDLVNYASVFGSTSFCNCTHCRSILSPAAYLVDLLHWLRDRGALDALAALRPDILSVKLTCENTNRTLPYIDLVLEVLENAVAPGTATTTDTTDLESQELLSAPEHVNLGAYTTLAAAVYPPTLPYEYDSDRSAAFLAQLGIPRHRLMEAFQRDTGGGVVDPTATQIAAEFLGMGPNMLGAVTNTLAADPWEYWGFDTESPGGTLWTTTLNGAGGVADAIARAELELPDLLDLLHTRFLNPSDTYGVSTTDLCDVEAYTFSGSPDATFFTKVMQFRRLWRISGFTVLQLDKVLTAIGATAIDGTAVQRVAQVKQLMDRTKLPVERLLTWWGHLDIWLDRTDAEKPVSPLYDQVFLDAALMPPAPRPVYPTAGAWVFDLDGTRTDLLNTTAMATAFKAELQATLRVDAADVDELIAHIQEEDSLATPDDVPLNLDSIGRMYRLVSLAKALKLPVATVRRLPDLLGVDPFVAGDAAARFLDLAADVKAIGLTADQLRYLLFHEADAVTLVGATDAWIQSVLGDLRDQTATLLAVEDVTIELMAQAETQIIAALAAAVGRDTTSIEDLRTRSFAALVGVVDFVDVLLDETFRAGAGDTADPWGDITRAAFPDQFGVVEVLHKIATVLNALDVDTDLQTWWLDHQTGFSLLTLNNLPLVATTVTSAPWVALRRTWLLRQLDERLPGSAPTLLELLANVEGSPGDPAAFWSAVADRTAWSAADLDTLSAELNVDTTAAVRLAENVHKVLDALDLVRRTGATAAVVNGWRVHAATSTIATEIFSTARSRYESPATWASVARPVRDQVRERQRQALVAYLVATDAEAEDASDLYGTYLIDVEMSACMLTSRIKQAIASVQSFVQRVFLGLEAPLLFNEEDAAAWVWMRRYRVWEAARKVFLYPENWIEPELRDDKSRFFEDLESQIQSGEVDEDRVEDAIVSYLEQLHEVSNLQPVALYHQKDTDADVLHVFARTRALPHEYWYRTRSNLGVWSPWEAVEQDIRTEHLMPIVFERRLMLFWAEFDEMAEPAATEGDPQNESWRVRISWSEYRRGKWSKKRTGKEFFPTDAQAVRTSPSVYSFRVVPGSLGDLRILMSTETGGERNVVAVFEFDSCSRDILPALADSAVEECWAPESADRHYQDFLRDPTNPDVIETPVEIPVYFVASDVWISGEPIDDPQQIQVLNQNPFWLTQVVPHQYEHFLCQDVFFTWAKDLAYFVEPTGADILSYNDGSNPADDPKFGSIKSQADGDLYENGSVGKQSSTPPGSFSGTQFSNLLDQGEDSQDAALEEIHQGLKDVDATVGDPLLAATDFTFKFSAFYHPYVCSFLEAVRRDGPEGLYHPAVLDPLYRQQLGDVGSFDATFDPEPVVIEPKPDPTVDFDALGAMSGYNWELFFHAPFLVADRLMRNRKFEDALRWFHAIFNPMNQDPADPVVDAPERYWMIKPFLEPMDALVTDWATFTGASPDDVLTAEEQAAKEAFEAQVEAWKLDPFNPHLIARMRRGPYQKAVFMRYLDNLIAWGDDLFAQDTIESINEATQLYVLAGQILGERPKAHPEPTVEAKSWNELEEDLDAFSNALVQVEDMLWESDIIQGAPTSSAVDLGATFYFCVPQNDKLLKYWDIVADRLHKIRHCQNLQGVVRQLALFEPPIDPSLLVRAAAAGVSLADVYGSLTTTRPHYRFATMVQRANALTGTVISLGQSLLSAIEKRDGEALALLRSTNGIAVLDATRDTREQQVEEAESNLTATIATRASAEERLAYYKDRAELSSEESKQLNRLQESLVLLGTAAAIQDGAAAVTALPNLAVGICSRGETGGSQLGDAVSQIASTISLHSQYQSGRAGILGTKAGYARRKEDWDLQASLAQHELTQIDKQIAAAEIRVQIAQKELESVELQRENALSEDEFMRSKFTNKQLYDWQVSQLSALYYQAFELAYSTALKAQACYTAELGRADTYVGYGHWDSLKKGLLAGERLRADLERMETGYLDHDSREMEITKHVSVGALDPVALAQLRERGSCYFRLPEEIFDLDFPGHYYRRIRGITLSLPSVAGPFSGVNATLTLAHSSLRTTADLTGGYARVTPTDERFADDTDVESVTLSGGQDDGGMFTFDLRDSRYLPFERRGAISTWKLALSGWDSGLPQIDWDSIGDVILHVRYTAWDGGDGFRESVAALVSTQLSNMDHADHAGNPLDPGQEGLLWGISAKRDFPDAWHAFLFPPEEDDDQVLTLPLELTQLPVAHQGAFSELHEARVYLLVEEPSGSGTLIQGTVTVNEVNLQVSGASAFVIGGDGALPAQAAAMQGVGVTTLGTAIGPFVATFTQAQLTAATDLDILTNDAGKKRLNPAELKDVIVVLRYSLS